MSVLLEQCHPSQNGYETVAEIFIDTCLEVDKESGSNVFSGMQLETKYWY
jgi:hypothetical protein